MGIPERVEPQKLDDYLDIMTMAVFQAGVSWAMVENKWPAFRKAFKQFDVAKVAKFKEADIDRLAEDATILRSKKKIAATVENARELLAVEKEFGSFRKFVRSFDSFAEVSAAIRKRFKYMGEMNVYYLLFRTNESVPPFDEWVETIPGDHPRMAEMVKNAKTRA